MATTTTSQKRPTDSNENILSSGMVGSAQIGLNRVLKKFRLSPGSPKALTGGRPLSLNTRLAYDKHFRGLKYFCCLIGDYESLLVLQEDAPSKLCPSMSAITVSNFLRFKKGKSGDILTDIYSKTVFDRHNGRVICQGGWNDPKNVKQCLSAISVLHATRQQRGQYNDSCASCWQDIHRDVESTGCFHHRGNAILWRSGDPALSEIVENTKKTSAKESLDYVVQGNFALMINELAIIRQRLVASSSIYDYQIWVMILVGVHLFLRSEEIEQTMR
jgi:hypothetical protein